MPIKSRFLVFEGVEGVGKSTQVEQLKRWLTAQEIDHVMTREPGGTPLAESIRQLVLMPRAEEICPETELLLMMAGRMQHWQHFIQPALARGQWVICDRFIDSSVAYQGAGRGLSKTMIRNLHSTIQPNMVPDLVFVLDMSIESAIERVQARGQTLDRMEQASMDFFERARASFLEMTVNSPERYIRLDATLDVATLALSIQHEITARLFA